MNMHPNNHVAVPLLFIMPMIIMPILCREGHDYYAQLIITYRNYVKLSIVSLFNQTVNAADI